MEIECAPWYADNRVERAAVTRKLVPKVKLVLEIDLDKLPAPPADEAGRILRYWAGAINQVDLGEQMTHELMDSAYQPVGTIKIV
ncbi:hypothetical protein [Haematomicrobium sanguinis]|uniref:hypothetical protein n=1 Tax=Haematomicrobium sanguinis TaxID=479106 RepID=UPI000558B9DA|nr:hypothetical protein [Haematomicrobium sanguinis]